MADVDVTILRVDTREAVQSIADLRDNIKILKQRLNEASIGTKEFQNTQKELTENQNALRNAMHASTASIEQVSKAAKGLDNSYNGLVAQMARAKEELRAIDTSTAEGMEAFKQKAITVRGFNEQLKALDAIQGNYQRNVGNYTGALDKFGQSFMAMGKGAAGAVAPIMGVNSALKVLNANPIVGTIAMLVAAFMKLVSAMKSSEEGSNGLKAALAPLQAVGDLVTRAMQALGNALGGIIGKMSTLLQKIFPALKKQMEEREEAVAREIAAQQRIRQINEDNAKSEQNIATLRAKMADKEAYTAEQRLEFAKQWQAELLAIAARNKEQAQTELAIAEAEAARSKNSKEANDALSAAKVKLIQVETEYQEQLRSSNKQLTTIRQELKATGKAVEDFAEGVEDAALDVNDKLDLTGDNVKKFYDTWAGIQDSTLDHAKRRNALLIEDEEKRAEADYQLTVAAQEKKLAFLEESITRELDPTRRLELMNARDELELQMEETKSGRLAEIDKQRTEKAKEEAAKRTEILKQGASAASGILGALADIYETEGDENEKNTRAAKALRIAGATIDMISGAVTAYSTAQKLGPPQGPIIGSANAAAVIAAGTANIAKIKATTVSKSSDGGTSAAVAAPPAVSTPVQRVATLTTASDEVRINNAPASKVYILSSDLEADRRDRRVRVQETTF